MIGITEVCFVKIDIFEGAGRESNASQVRPAQDNTSERAILPDGLREAAEGQVGVFN